MQCLPYKGLPESTIRSLINRLIEEMVQRNMNVAGIVLYTLSSIIVIIIIIGLVTNGEHNGLRTKGNTQPLHVFQLKVMARAKVSKIGYEELLSMLTPKGIILFV